MAAPSDSPPNLAVLQPVKDLRRALSPEVADLTGTIFRILLVASLAAVWAVQGTVTGKKAARTKRDKWVEIAYIFQTASGEEYEGKDKERDLASTEGLEEGQPIPIAYLPDEPKTNVHFSPRWLARYGNDEVKRVMSDSLHKHGN